jgi:single-stranded DNA-binding protein
MPTMVTIVGNLVKDPEEKDFGSDKNVTNIIFPCCLIF